MSLRRMFCGVLDLLVTTLLVVVVSILVSGGGSFAAGDIRIRARTVDNPLLGLAAAIVLRYAVGRAVPLLGMRAPLQTLCDRAADALSPVIPDRIARAFSRPWRVLGWTALLVFVVKAFFAWQLPGFFSGDDVEIHQMTIGALYRQRWPVWELRSAFFPMLFIYPAQWLAAALGATAPETLVLAGRLVVACLSTLVIPLTWIAVRRVEPADRTLAALAVLFVATDRLLMSFGSSELPRPVATVFVLAAFVVSRDPRVVGSALTGGLLGIAAAFRFSEFVFLAAALLTLPRQRLFLRAAVVVFVSIATTAAITAVSDALYWGSPLSSVKAAVEYTLIHRDSSRGFQPVWEYVRLVPSWSTFVFVVLAIAGSSRRHADSWWLWVAFVLLSLLPHKESRYLIPLMPFLAMAAARGFQRSANWLSEMRDAQGWRRWARHLYAPALVLSLLHEASGWRLSRSNEGVRLAQYVRASIPAGFAGQDLWRLGGHPYLWRHDPLISVTPELFGDATAAATAVEHVQWIALRVRTARTGGEEMARSLGFERVEAWRGEDYVLYARVAR